MAGTALAQINPLPAVLSGIFGERAGPGNIVCIDVNSGCFRIHRRAAPFRATIEAGKDDGIFSNGERHELAFAAESAEALDCPLMRGSRAVGQKILGQNLPRVGSWTRRKGLFGPSDFTGHVTGRVIASLHWKERLSVGAVEQINESLFGDLRDRVYVVPIALHG